MEFKDLLFNEIDTLLLKLKDFKKLELHTEQNKNLKEIFEEIKKELEKGIERISRDLFYLKKNVEWNTFNVAFFGETNAGKSTLIEALTRGNGKSIGDGRKDFTKTVNSRVFRKVKLIDMPGIEGNENRVINEIRTAVQKSHVVFYVIGTNKEPEEGTIKKVKNFLHSNAKVYTIINVRGKPSVYKYKKTLVDDTILKVQKRIDAKMKKILNGHYQGSLIINAYLGFLAMGKPVREDLLKDKEKALKIFGNIERIYNFSNLKELEELIFSLSEEAKKEIKISNTYKFLRTISEVLNRVLKNKKGFDKALNNLIEETKKAERDLKDIFNKYKHQIENKLKVLLKEMENEINRKIQECIDNELGEEIIKIEIDLVSENYKYKINEEINKLIKEMENEIQKRIEILKNRLDIKTKFGITTSGFDLDIKSISESLKVGLGETLREIGDVIIFAIEVFVTTIINPLLGIITGIFTLLRKLWDWFFGNPNKKKREAKEKAYKEVKRAFKEIEKNILTQQKFKFKKIEKDIRKNFFQYSQSLIQLKSLSIKLDEYIKSLRIAHRNLSTILAHEILSEKVELAFIDLTIKPSSMLIIGVKEIDNYYRKLFRVDKVLCYSSINELLFGNNFIRSEKNTIYVKDEFLFRALNAFFADNHFYKIRKEVEYDK